MKNRIGIFFILLASILGALPLCAQESCYAQYLREHNMRVLTAEDADDSYDELKKAVLAWQLYGSEASLPFAPKEEPAAPQLQDTTFVIVHLALVDSTWYMWLSVDPLADKYPNVTPYLYCNGNPIMLVDPDGNDWYEADGEIKWTDCKSQQSMNDAKISGTYLGEAVVVFNGYYDEQLGSNDKLIDIYGNMPKGAKMADVTVYGPNGSNDINNYLGYTMSSDPHRFAVLANGDYDVNRVVKLGPYDSPWAIENRGNVPTLYDTNPAHPDRKPAYMNGVFIHRYNNDGKAGVFRDPQTNKWHGRSEGCLLIAPNHWKSFEQQLQKVNSFHLKLNRK